MSEAQEDDIFLSRGQPVATRRTGSTASKAPAKRDRRLDHICPSFCHRCPEMQDMVMPMCWGSAMSEDEYDLSACGCDPREPIVARLELADGQRTLIRLLRDARRRRSVQVNTVRRIQTIVSSMGFSADRIGLQRALRDIGGLASQLHSELRQAPDAVDPSVPSRESGSTRAKLLSSFSSISWDAGTTKETP